MRPFRYLIVTCISVSAKLRKSNLVIYLGRRGVLQSRSADQNSRHIDLVFRRIAQPRQLCPYMRLRPEGLVAGILVRVCRRGRALSQTSATIYFR